MPVPCAILISDIHYSLPTLELADNAMRQAIAKANELDVPLIVAGDLHDTKANLRGECVNQIIKTFKLCKTKCYVLLGNHDRINEKSAEHSLNFLEPYCTLVNSTQGIDDLKLLLIAYNSDPSAAVMKIKREAINKGARFEGRYASIIMHQGIIGSNSGDYIQDKSAINPQDVAGMRVISGHYHTRQTIKLPDGGQWDYIGNPYTLNYGEANDPLKGFQILMSDGSLEFVPTNLRKHIVFNITPDTNSIMAWDGEDLVWIKAKGPRSWLNTINKSIFGLCKLTLEPTDLNIKAPTKQLSNSELLDNLIDSTDNTPETKERLKSTWKNLCES